MVKTASLYPVIRKWKAVSALFPYAVRLAGGGQPQLIDAFLRVATAWDYRGVIWYCVKPFMATLFDEPSTPSLDRIITLVSPCLDWRKHHFNQNAVTRWSTVALDTLAVPYTEEVGWGVVITLLRIVSVDTLRQHIPVSIWSWSNTQAFPPFGQAVH